MKRLLKSKRGMSLMEILVALSLLMIIIVGTTPVMLQAYNGLYTAGEKTQETYEAKSEIEEMLATRNTRNVYPGFVVNFKNLGEVASLNGRRAVSSLYGSLETLFTNARVRVAIISSRTVNDDYACDFSCDAENNGGHHEESCGWHEVVIQTTNLDFGTVDKAEAQAKISINNEEEVVDGDENRTKIIDITFIIPNKSTDVLEQIYTYHGQDAKLATVDYDNIVVDPITGRITVRINGFDFTQSPIKLYVSYLDENNKKQTTETYLFVDTPTIIVAGETGTYDYYTSPGFVQKTKSTIDASGNVIDKNVTESFEVYGRTMRTDNATGTQAIPAGTIFKSVNWITETTKSGELVGNVYAPSYYVLTGTNGAIYRTYSFVKSGSVAGKVKLDTTDAQFNGIDQAAMADVIGVTDEAYILDDRASTRVYPAVWGGDFSHIYGYSAYHKYGNYINEDTWYTQSETNSGVGQAGYYSNKANFGYYYNGWGFNYDFNTQNSKKISYILTELENSLRVGGYLEQPGDFDAGVNRIWERPLNPDGTQQTTPEQIGYSNSGVGYFYKKAGESLIRCTIIKINKKGEYYKTRDLNQVPTYFCNNAGVGNDSGRWGESCFAQLRIKGLTTISPTFLDERGNDDGATNTISSFKFVHNTSANKSKIAVTDAVYIPSATGGAGSVFYVGTVAAYGIINQNDNYTTRENYASSILNNGEDNEGYTTTYYVMGNDEGTATSVYKYSSSDWGRQDGNMNVFKNKTQVTGTGVSANTDESREFFVTRNTGAETSKLFNDVLFTMGFTSNREMVYSKIVYGKDESGTLKQAYKYCEPLYYLSHYGDTTDTHTPNLYMNYYASTKNSSRGSNGYSDNITNDYLNAPDNDYYNVWFPGEMYNLTKTATKEGVTVSVGYAVSGSTYTWLNTAQPTNSSTALSGIHNDGVIAGIVSGSDTSFSSLLYFKDKENFDNYSLSDGSLSAYSGNNTYTNLIGADYGTHTRDSVQFIAVDIGIQYTNTSPDENNPQEKATYYAYYADNKGRVFRSKVATRSATSSGKATPVKVQYISDTIVQPGDSRLSSDTIGYMEQLKLSDGSDFSAYFDKITTIKCEGDHIIIAGHSRQDGTRFNIALGTVQSDGTVTFKCISLDVNGIQNYVVEDALLLDGYVYCVGVNLADNTGFVYVYSLQELKDAQHNGTVNFVDSRYVGTPDALYAIDGHK